MGVVLVGGDGSQVAWAPVGGGGHQVCLWKLWYTEYGPAAGWSGTHFSKYGGGMFAIV